MKNHWRILLNILPESLERECFKIYFKSLHKKWLAAGQPDPPSHYSKQLALKRTAELNNIKVLVETGTYMGDMLYMMSPLFHRLYSIELSPLFYQRAKKRFRTNDKIHLLQGDSASCLHGLVEQLNEPVLFWLDGHYSGGLTALGSKECPVLEELTAVLKSPYLHVIVIDDARLFVGANDYPTLDELSGFIKKTGRSFSMRQENDSVIIQLQ